MSWDEEIQSWIRIFQKAYGDKARAEARKLARRYYLEHDIALTSKWTEIANRL